MMFRRNKGVLPSQGFRRGGTEADPLLAAKVQKLDALQKMLVELQNSIRVYMASLKTMCKASTSIAEGLANLAGDGEAMEVSPLLNVAQMYYTAHTSIDSRVREAAQSVVEHTTLREMEALLSRFPPIYHKISRRRQLLTDVEFAKSKVRAAEAAKDKGKDRFAAVAGAEHRRRMAASLSRAEAVADGVAKEVMADVDRLNGERKTMLVSPVSELVGCQAYFMRRSAAVLERLASKLPFSALALARLVLPGASDLSQSHSSPLAVPPKEPLLPSDHVSSRPSLPLFPDTDNGSTSDADHAGVAAVTQAVDATVQGVGEVAQRALKQMSPAQTAMPEAVSPLGYPDETAVKPEADISRRHLPPPPPQYDTVVHCPSRQSALPPPPPQYDTFVHCPSRQSALPPPPSPPRQPLAHAVVLLEKGGQGSGTDVLGMIENHAGDEDVEVW